MLAEVDFFPRRIVFSEDFAHSVAGPSQSRAHRSLGAADNGGDRPVILPVLVAQDEHGAIDRRERIEGRLHVDSRIV